MLDTWKAGGPRLSFADVCGWTPHQVAALFYRPAAARGGFDRVAELGKANARRAASGLRPACPSWHLPHLRRV